MYPSNVATTIHDEVNNVHNAGYALDGTTTGNSFFVYDATGGYGLVFKLAAADVIAPSWR